MVSNEYDLEQMHFTLVLEDTESSFHRFVARECAWPCEQGSLLGNRRQVPVCAIIVMCLFHVLLEHVCGSGSVT